MQAILIHSMTGQEVSVADLNPDHIEDPQTYTRHNPATGAAERWVGFYVEGYYYKARFDWLPAELQARLTPFAPLNTFKPSTERKNA